MQLLLAAREGILVRDAYDGVKNISLETAADDDAEEKAVVAAAA
ncbi:hypothetical protein [Streptomyces rhizoryzae]|nr:hypothetical protein [Streptomyces rhizoryzae]